MSQFAFNPHSNTEQQQKQPIDSQNFFRWTSNNFYRTSYQTMKNNQQVENKNSTITGYGGFIPGINSDSKFSQSYTKITKECFANENLGKNTNNLASTGFNYKTHDFVDQTKHQVSHKYGSSSIIKNHPCSDGKRWMSQTTDSFRQPTSLTKPTFRETNKFLSNTKLQCKQSGYQSNINVCDGQGWAPHKVLDGDRVMSNYRIDISRSKPVHRETQLLSLRKHIK